MLNLRHRISLRVPDRLAIVAALALSLTAAGGVVGETLLATPESVADATALPVSAEQDDPASDDAARPGGLTASLLFFRNG